MTQALTNVLLMDAVMACLQTQRSITAASKLAYFDKITHEGLGSLSLLLLFLLLVLFFFLFTQIKSYDLADSKSDSPLFFPSFCLSLTSSHEGA